MFTVYKVVKTLGWPILREPNHLLCLAYLLTAQDLQQIPNEINTVYYAMIQNNDGKLNQS